MKFISTWSFLPGAQPKAAKQFLAKGGAVPEGATLLGRWHRADMTGGFVLIETDDARTAYDNAALWAETLVINTHPVLEDDQVGPILAKHFG